MIPKHLKRGPIPGLPDSALSDCLFLTGKRGYGKSYTQRDVMERALTLGMRCGWIDAMGIGWGVTVAADGRPGFPNVVIFGGEHAHLPISEGSASALGATLARATFSWVLDLTSLPGKASRVRFLADFCEALYETNRNQLLLFLDEVDLWAPQNIMDKQGPAPRLLGLIDEIVRRGRVKGLSAWMATQRPAVVNKNVISQADGVVTLKLTLPHDIDAVMLWMRKHLGKERAAEYELKIPGLKRGEALVYLTEPDVSVSLAQFPMIKTLDNMKAREPGDAELVGQRATVDLEEIRTQLGDIEAELKENDPAELRRRIQELERELEGAGPDPESDSALEHARQEGFVRGSELAAELEHNAWKRDYAKKAEAQLATRLPTEAQISYLLEVLAREGVANAGGDFMRRKISKAILALLSGAATPAPTAALTEEELLTPELIKKAADAGERVGWDDVLTPNAQIYHRAIDLKKYETALRAVLPIIIDRLAKSPPQGAEE